MTRSHFFSERVSELGDMQVGTLKKMCKESCSLPICSNVLDRKYSLALLWW